MRTAALLLAAAVAGCGAREPVVAESGAPVAQDTRWRMVATDADRARLRMWRTTWIAAVAEARAADPDGVAAQGRLFDPDRVLPDAIPPAGTYRCRTFKLGAKGTAMRGFTAYPWFECRIDRAGDAWHFAKMTGSQRPVGSIFADGPSRAIFLGTLVLGDESGVLAYGRDTDRDMGGLVERVGPARWRIAFPEPRFESKLDVMELIPAG